MDDFEQESLSVDDFMPLDTAAALLGQGFILEDVSLQAEFSTYFTD